MRWMFGMAALALLGCASVSAGLTGSQRQVVLSGKVRSAGGPYELRKVSNGAITDTVVARARGASGPRPKSPALIPVNATFDLPAAALKSDTRCLAIVDRTDAPVQVRGRGEGVGRFAFSNPAWSAFASHAWDLDAAQSARDEAARRLQRLQADAPAASQRLSANRGYASGACMLPPQAPEPSRPAQALDPGVRIAQVNQTCERVAQQRLGCDVYVDMMRQMGLPATLSACGQNQAVVPPDALTGWANYFENSLVQTCIKNGKPMSCGLARRAFRSRQEHCRRIVGRPYESAYTSWNARVSEIRAEPQRSLNRCLSDLLIVRDTPRQIDTLEQSLAQAEQVLADLRSKAPANSGARDLRANVCS